MGVITKADAAPRSERGPLSKAVANHVSRVEQVHMDEAKERRDRALTQTHNRKTLQSMAHGDIPVLEGVLQKLNSPRSLSTSFRRRGSKKVVVKMKPKNVVVKHDNLMYFDMKGTTVIETMKPKKSFPLSQCIISQTEMPRRSYTFKVTVKDAGRKAGSAVKNNYEMVFKWYIHKSKTHDAAEAAHWAPSIYALTGHKEDGGDPLWVPSIYSRKLRSVEGTGSLMCSGAHIVRTALMSDGVFYLV
eukprot:FR735320.1.p1 GENE.FR735320.1~~FR735320.1.p1  ORF type:complete len:245 (+),score=4.81 FR735320.1:105-839(+)